MKKIFLVLVLLGITSVGFSYVTEKPTPALSKSLAFPVWGKRSNIGSFWGDVRDGGQRSHQGIDIFAKKGTPVVAVCGGIITSVATTPRGGKVVWLQAFGHPWSAYYAHLDEQKVRRGQVVKKGQVVGTVGNTGNAKTTPPHLHFGIYKWTGAVNPLPYVKHSPKLTAPAVSKPDAKKTVAKTEDSNKQKQTAASPLASKYISKKLSFSSDPSAQYYVTVRSNVVRVQNGKLQVVGKWKKANSAKYSYQIDLTNHQTLYVNKAGKIVTAKGQAAGSVS